MRKTNIKNKPGKVGRGKRPKDAINKSGDANVLAAWSKSKAGLHWNAQDGQQFKF